MPRMATLSLIPLAMLFSLSFPHRDGFPEIAYEAALLVKCLDAEGHTYRQTDINLTRLHIGEIGQEPATVIEGDHAVVGWRIHGEGEVVRRLGQHLGWLFAEGVGLHGIIGVAIGIDADIAAGKLRCTTGGTAATHQP